MPDDEKPLINPQTNQPYKTGDTRLIKESKIETPQFIEPIIKRQDLAIDYTNYVDQVYNADKEHESFMRESQNDLYVVQERNKFFEDLKKEDTQIAFKHVDMKSLLESKASQQSKVKYDIIKTKEAFVSLREKSETKLKENAFDFGYDTDVSSNDPNSEYLPLMMGPFYRQLYLFDYLDMQRKAFWAWNHDPIAKQICRIITYFALGRGMSFSCKNEQLENDFRTWWEDNNMDKRIESACTEMSIYGEIMFRKVGTGKDFKLKPIDPSTVWEIVTDPADIENVYFYHCQFPTQYQIMAKDKPVSKYIIEQIPWNEVIHEKINCVSNEKRGRSELFPILGLLKRLRDYTNARVLKGILQTNMTWDLLIKGSQADVNNALSQDPSLQAAPKPGSVYIHNEAIELTPKTADLKTNETHLDFEMILTLIASGTGMPKEYLNIGDKTTRATSIIASEPVYKKFQDRQLVIERLCHKIYETWLFLSGADIKYKGTDLSIEFTFPELSSEDRSVKLKDLALAESMDWLSHETVQAVAAKEFHISTFDNEVENAEIKSEKNVMISQQFARVEKAKSATPAEGVM